MCEDYSVSVPFRGYVVVILVINVIRNDGVKVSVPFRGYVVVITASASAIVTTPSRFRPLSGLCSSNSTAELSFNRARIVSVPFRGYVVVIAPSSVEARISPT